MTPREASSDTATIVVKSAGLNYVSNIVRLVASLCTTMFYARILAPEEFGLLAIAQVSIRLSEVLADFGLGNAVVQRKKLSRSDIHTALSLSLLAAAGLYGVLAALAPWLAGVLGEQRLIQVLRLLSVSVFFTASSTVLRGLLRRQMRFGALATIETSTQIAAHVFVGIPMVAMGYGVLGMIGASIGAAASSLTVLLILCRASVGFGLSMESATGLYSYGSRITLIALVQVAGHISQPLLMAKALGAGSVGIFTTSLRLVSLPVEGVTTALRNVLFPVFCSSGSVAGLRSRFLMSYFLLANAIVAWSCFVFAAADQLVLLVLGEKWMAAVPIVRILAFGCAFAYMGSVVGTLIDSSLDLNAKLKVDVCYLLALLGSIVVLYPRGMMAVIAAYAALEAFRWVCYGLISLPAIGVKAASWFGMHLELWPLLAAFAIMLLCAHGADTGSPAARVLAIGGCGLAGVAGMASALVVRMGWRSFTRLIVAVRTAPVNARALVMDTLRQSALSEA